MEKELLQTKLINQNKNTKQKRVAFNVSQILGAFLIILIIFTFSRGNIDPLYIKLKFPFFLTGLMYLIPAILAVILLFLLAYKPASGHLLFYDEHIDFKIKNSIKKINISELTKLTFSNNEYRYSIGLINNNQKIFYEIDIIFQHEKEIINSLVKKWKDKGYNVDIINKNEIDYQKLLINNDEINKDFPSYQNSTQNSNNSILKYDFTKYNIKLQPGFPFEFRITIPYLQSSKKELFILTIESFKKLDWAVDMITINTIEGVTDKVFKLSGNTISVDFSINIITISCFHAGSGLFPYGGKTNLKDLLYIISDLSNKLNPESLKERYDSMFPIRN